MAVWPGLPRMGPMSVCDTHSHPCQELGQNSKAVTCPGPRIAFPSSVVCSTCDLNRHRSIHGPYRPRSRPLPAVLEPIVCTGALEGATRELHIGRCLCLCRCPCTFVHMSVASCINVCTYICAYSRNSTGILLLFSLPHPRDLGRVCHMPMPRVAVLKRVQVRAPHPSFETVEPRFMRVLGDRARMAAYDMGEPVSYIHRCRGEEGEEKTIGTGPTSSGPGADLTGKWPTSLSRCWDRRVLMDVQARASTAKAAAWPALLSSRAAWI